METSPITEEYKEFRASMPEGGTVDWTAPGLRVTRFRLLSDPGFPMWDVSYCDGILPINGVDHFVNVSLPFHQLYKRTRMFPAPSLASQIVKHAIRSGVNAKRMGILAAISTYN